MDSFALAFDGEVIYTGCFAQPLQSSFSPIDIPVLYDLQNFSGVRIYFKAASDISATNILTMPEEGQNDAAPDDPEEIETTDPRYNKKIRKYLKKLNLLS